LLACLERAGAARHTHTRTMEGGMWEMVGACVDEGAGSHCGRGLPTQHKHSLSAATHLSHTGHQLEQLLPVRQLCDANWKHTYTYMHAQQQRRGRGGKVGAIARQAGRPAASGQTTLQKCKRGPTPPPSRHRLHHCGHAAHRFPAHHGHSVLHAARKPCRVVGLPCGPCATPAALPLGTPKSSCIQQQPCPPHPSPSPPDGYRATPAS
jgi:hypothetical protein